MTWNAGDGSKQWALLGFCADDGSDDDDDDDGDDDALWLENEKGSDEVEDESIFTLDPDSVAVVQVEGEASVLENI
jgi:hypothetical protein